jgi:hypothetical protein
MQSDTQGRPEELHGFKGDFTLRTKPIEMWAGTQINQVIENSQFWTSIQMIINFLEQHPAFNTEQELRDYMKQGLENTITKGYNLEKRTYVID